MEFAKYVGAGNDFILLRGGTRQPWPELARRLCDRRRGIGADGLLIAEKSECAAVRMRYFNADGSAAALCGNGLRCFAAWAVAEKLVEDADFCVETDAGVRQVSIEAQGCATVEIGTAQRCNLPLKQLPKGCLRAEFMLMGVPHLVLFYPHPERVPLAQLGRKLEQDAAFDHGTNVDLVGAVPGGLRIFTWERGSGHTPACGTGCCAAAATAGILPGESMRLYTEGGPLTVRCDAKGMLWLSGEAKFVFSGRIKE